MSQVALRIAVFGALLAGIVVFLASGIRILDDPEDFRAFYCAGQTVFAHHDPYLTEPLRSCEIRETLAAGLTPYLKLALPAPLPGYAFVPFVLIGLLPFAQASSLYVMLVAAAFAATAIVMTKLTRVPALAIVAVLALSDGVVSLFNGQILPFALLALCACGFELKRGHDRMAVVYAALAAIEPHVALPAWLALAVAMPKTRVPLVLAGAGLAVIALLVTGLHGVLEYVTQVLPAHARSEASATGQYSLTTLLVRSGMHAALAIKLADLSYAAMCVAGVAVARKLALRFDAPEMLAMIPPAFALFGGPFIHITQMAVAVPALLLLVDKVPARRGPLSIALVLLALPWQDLVENSTAAVCVAIVLVCAAVALQIWKIGRGGFIALALATLALGLFEQWLRVHFAQPHVDATHAIALADANGRFAEATWEAFTTLTENADARLYLLSRLPTWIGVTIMIVAAASATLSKDLVPVRTRS